MTQVTATQCITMGTEEFSVRSTPYQADCRGNGLLTVSLFSLGVPQHHKDGSENQLARSPKQKCPGLSRNPEAQGKGTQEK